MNATSMTTDELLDTDAEIGRKLDNWGPGSERTWLTERRTVRTELNRRDVNPVYVPRAHPWKA